jgi:hypothetical protein
MAWGCRPRGEHTHTRTKFPQKILELIGTTGFLRPGLGNVFVTQEASPQQKWSTTVKRRVF